MALTVSVDEIVQSSRNLLLAARPHWKRVRLRDVASVLNGFAFKSSQFTRGAGIPLIRIRDVGGDSTDTNYAGEFDERYVVDPGDLLIGMDGDFNCARWKGPRGLLNQRVCKVTLENERYHPRFLDYALPGYLKAINGATSSVTVKHLSARTVEDIPLPFPPIAEQQQIVAELEKQFSRLDDAVTNLRRVKGNLKRYKAAVLKAAVEGRLVPTEAERARREGCTSWQRVRIGDVAQVISGLTKNPKRQGYLRKLPYLRVANVYANELRLDDIEYIGVADSEVDKLLLCRGDMLVVEGNGSPDQIGRVALWDGSIANCVHQNHLIKVRFGREAMPEWALIWMLSPWGRREIEQVSSSTSGLHTLSTGKISRLPMPLPSAAEQRRIVAEVDRRLSLVSEVEVLLGTSTARVRSLRQTVLAHEFQADSRGTENKRDVA
jgi:type I restriction enzyme, S subunit